MPRMSKKRKQEWALFLNERNRITYNELCRKCSNDSAIQKSVAVAKKKVKAEMRKYLQP